MGLIGPTSPCAPESCNGEDKQLHSIFPVHNSRSVRASHVSDIGRRVVPDRGSRIFTKTLDLLLTSLFRSSYSCARRVLAVRSPRERRLLLRGLIADPEAAL